MKVDDAAREALATVPGDVAEEMRALGDAVDAVLRDGGPGAAAAAALLEAMREHGSALAMLAGAGDRHHDPGALHTIATIVVLRAVSAGEFGALAPGED